MQRILLATDAVGALVWGATIGALGHGVAASVQRPGDLVEALVQHADATVVLISGPGLGVPAASLVAAVRAAAPDRAVIAVPAEREHPAACAAAGADVVVGAGDPDARKAVLVQACTALQTRSDLAAAREQAGRAQLRDPASGAVTLPAAGLLLDHLLGRAPREGAPVAVLALEPDGLADLVAAHGPAALPTVSTELLARVRAAVRPYDIVSVVGDGTVVVALYPCTAEQGIGIAERLLEMAERRAIVMGGARVSLRCSLGLATWTPGEPRVDAVTLIERATDALVEARLDGGDQLAVAG